MDGNHDRQPTLQPTMATACPVLRRPPAGARAMGGNVMTPANLSHLTDTALIRIVDRDPITYTHEKLIDAAAAELERRGYVLKDPRCGTDTQTLPKVEIDFED